MAQATKLVIEGRGRWWYVWEETRGRKRRQYSRRTTERLALDDAHKRQNDLAHHAVYARVTYARAS